MADFPYGRDYPEAQWLDRDGSLLTDDPYADVPPPEEPPGGTHTDTDEPTTWSPVDLGPYLRGEIERPQPSLGITRSDGLRLIYPGREHAVLGETESGKSWFALACAAAELATGAYVVYIHFEESDAGSTVERLRVLGVDPTVILSRLRFVAPARPVRAEWLAPLLDPVPALVVHDGVNEGMSLHSAETKAVEGLSLFRRRLVTPFIRAGAAVLSCDHMPMGADGSRRDAYGSVHKGNVLDGSRILLENAAPMGRGMRGVSYVFVTKDRPGCLRAHGRPTKSAGKTFVGTLVVDDSQTRGPDLSLRFFAPKADEDTPESSPGDADRETVFAAIAESPDHAVASKRALRAQLRLAGAGLRNTRIDECVDELVACGRLRETPGKRGACRYEAVLTGSRPGSDSSGSATGSGSGSPIGREPGTGHHSTGSEPVGTGGNRSTLEADDDTDSDAISVVTDQLGATTISTERRDQ
ncbi:hypothetical protein PJK45_17885 [Mycobacterium kansasii]|uniref:AAA domain protein n=7 Tax=Mycobacterium kansasii TaxID=1768 RepID=A0A1V3XPJ3_MYCKA|nr:hypothetical protein [Mycobacterium kansasii]AGZ51095.1 hypothetical protein MKAN_13100 [Mycobacterium kansasii ATCC 12478]ARG57126.1 hypothetical protein B1T43_15970 [Mycobacterium kansasii]ARG62650.1 hypothetical protein B1T45_16505 [Mycobacterium kansasii]ARG70269.1 hypothetical protein B1T47_15735 [Mycobacterium kansasii]ARG75121.1 hypothetical protein B1T51_12360 [Mycobacterium kansasii]